MQLKASYGFSPPCIVLYDIMMKLKILLFYVWLSAGRCLLAFCRALLASGHTENDVNVRIKLWGGYDS